MSKRNKFIMQSRGLEVDELLKDPNAFVLLTLIARRARRTDAFNRYNLNLGEALIGDCEAIGLTEQEYRSAKKRLKKYGLATFKGTNKGTIATLCNSLIYDINIEDSNDQGNDQATDDQRPANEQATTNNNDNNENNEQKGNNGGESTPPPYPTFDNCIQFFDDNGGLREWGFDFWHYWNDNDWKHRSGKPITWKAKALKWIQEEREKSGFATPAAYKLAAKESKIN